MKKLLIVENDIDILEIVSYLFEDMGFTVFRSPKTVSIEKITEINPDIVIIDYLLDGSLGSDICSEIKSNSLLKQIPVILISASSELEHVAHESLADAFILKPFDLYELEKTVNDLAL